MRHNAVVAVVGFGLLAAMVAFPYWWARLAVAVLWLVYGAALSGREDRGGADE